MSQPISTIMKELVKGFGDEAVFDACQAFVKQSKRKEKKQKTPSAWQQFVKEVHAELKKTKPNVKISEASKEASRRRKTQTTIQGAIDKIKQLPPLPKSRGTTEGWRTETNTEYPSDEEINVDQVD